MTLSPLEVPLALALQPVRAEPLDRLPGSSADDPFLRLAAGWLLGRTLLASGSRDSTINVQDVHTHLQYQPRQWANGRAIEVVDFS